jgi:hypothetical protein
VINDVAHNDVNHYDELKYNVLIITVHTIQFLQTYVHIEEYCLLGYNAMQSTESQPTFRRNISPLSLGSKNKPSKIPA